MQHKLLRSKFMLSNKFHSGITVKDRNESSRCDTTTIFNHGGIMPSRARQVQHKCADLRLGVKYRVTSGIWDVMKPPEEVLGGRAQRNWLTTPGRTAAEANK